MVKNRSLQTADRSVYTLKNSKFYIFWPFMIQKAERNDQKMTFFGFYFNTSAKQKSFFDYFWGPREKTMHFSPEITVKKRNYISARALNQARLPGHYWHNEKTHFR
jgi:hypothetical protein